ncbi:MAG: YciI family protein [Steroidobacteraceae bacterium]|nr:YciI family protein [Steroidobacteraceae bacterium]
MQYMLMFYEDPADAARGQDPVHAEAYRGAWMSYIGAMVQAGVFRAGEELADARHGTTVRTRQGRRWVQDGPVADTKEHLGGYAVIEVPTLDDAVEWAARSPSAQGAGATEVRPVQPQPDLPG